MVLNPNRYQVYPKCLYLLLICILCGYVRGDNAGKSTKYALDLPDCKIPEIELLGKAILPEWNVPFTSTCNQPEQIGRLSDSKMLKFDSVAKYESCCFLEISRPEILVSDTYELSPCQPITNGMEVDMTNLNYIMVNCSRKADPDPSTKKRDPYHYEFHYNVPNTSPRIQAKLDFWKTQETKPFSVMFLILDSVSTAHALRSMPKSIKHLQENLGFTTYKAYHALGEPTIENYIPMLLGIPTSHPGWSKEKPSYKGKYDNEPFIWKNFSRSNYVTMWTEDMAYWHTLNFNGRTGHTNKTFDLNTRPYLMIHEKHAPRTSYRLKYGTVDLNYMALNCVDGKNIWDFMLDYTYEFLQKFQDTPRFSMMWPGWPNHDFLPSTQKFDEPILNLFKKLETKTKVLDNTIIFLMGDHGFRWSNYSEMKEGLFERNLPLFMVRLPPTFQKMYPEAAKAVKTNAERLTSHLDLFKTLVHLHELEAPEVTKYKHLPYGYNQSYGTSLFKEISDKRSCSDASIPQQFCSCNFPLNDENFDYVKYRKTKVVEGLSILPLAANSSKPKS